MQPYFSAAGRVGDWPATPAPSEDVARAIVDLDNCLAAVTAQAQALRALEPGGAADDGAAMLIRIADSGAQAVTRLRAAVGATVPPECAPVDLADVLTRAVRSTRFRWGLGPDHGVAGLHLDLGGTPPVMGDADSLAEVFTGLILCACDGATGARTVTVRSHFDGIHAIASITADGPPVPDSRVRPHLATGGEDPRAALPRISDLILGHSGHFTVDATADERTTFFVMLHPPLLGAPRPATAGRLPRLRVLLVEDDAAARQGIGDILEMSGLQVTRAASGGDAMRALASPFDVVLTDYELGDMTGLEVARAARQRYAQTLVMLVTGWDDDLGGAARQVDVVLRKPVGHQQLLLAIGSLGSPRHE